MSVTQLPKSTIRLLSSTQVITSVSSVVKELVENSLDAGAENIEIRLEKHGLEKIEVKDDGCGIQEADCICMGLPHYTSKLKSFSELDELESYGFRGEALHSVCSIASVSVTTKTNDEITARRYKLDKSGQPVQFDTVHGVKGTTVTVTNLFRNLPVRRQFMSCTKRMNEELRKVESIVKSLSVINPIVRVSLAHNKCLIWQKNAVHQLRLSVMQVFSYNVTKHLHHLTHLENKVELEMLVPKCDCDVTSLCLGSGSGIEAYYLFVNKRPIKDKEIEKAISEILSKNFGHNIPPNKSLMSVVALTLPPDRLDVNLEPNKTRIFIRDKEEILSCISDQLNSYYGKSTPSPSSELTEVDEPKAKRKRKADEVERMAAEEKDAKLVQSSVRLSNNSSSLDINQHSSPSNQNNCSSSVQVANQQNNPNEDSVPVGSDPFQSIDMNCYLTSEVVAVPFPDQNNKMEIHQCKQASNIVPLLPDEPIISGGQDSLLSSPSNFDPNDLFGLPLDAGQVNNLCTELSSQKRSTPNGAMNEYLLSADRIIDVSTEHRAPIEEEKPSLAIFKPGTSTGNCESFSELTGECPVNDNEELPQQKPAIFGGNPTNAFENGLSLSQWSRGGLISGENKIMGSCVLKQPLIEEKLGKEKSEKNRLGANYDYHMENIKRFTSTSNTEKEDSKLLQGSIAIGNISSNEECQKNSPSLMADDGRFAENYEVETEAATNSFLDEKHFDLERSVSSQMGNKQMSGFTAFARQMRSQILKDSPGMSFTVVAGILASKWRTLQEHEKNKFNQIALSNKKDKKKNKIHNHDAKKENTNSPSCNTPPLERTIAVCDVSLESLFSAAVNNDFRISDSNIVGQLESSNLWICIRSMDQNINEIGLIHSHHLDEAYKFKVNMNLMEIPVQALQHPIVINTSSLKENLWEILMRLESKNDASREEIFIIDKRIVMNGFRIKISLKGEDICACFTHLARHVIDLYGVEDLQHTLELIEKHRIDNCSLAQSRCSKVEEYIKSETIKQCTQMKNHDSLNDVLSLENRFRTLQNDKSTHWESFYKTLHALS